MLATVVTGREGGGEGRWGVETCGCRAGGVFSQKK